MFYANNPQTGIIMSGESSRTTHEATPHIDLTNFVFLPVVVGILSYNLDVCYLFS